MADEPRQILEHLRRLQSIVDVLAWIASRFDKATDALEKQAAIDDVIRELDKRLTEDFDHINQVLLLLLERLPDKGASQRITYQTNQLKKQTIDNRVRSLKTQLSQQHANLNWLEEQSAKYGSSVTLEITNSIIFTKEKIQEITEELHYLKEELEKIG